MTTDTTRIRVVPLQGQPNFRDLGGYPTDDGRTTRWGLVYRSGELSQLTNADVSRLEDLGIATVVDLRSAREIDERGPDVVPAGAEHVHLPIDQADRLTDLITERFDAGDFTDPAPSLLAEVNRALVTDWLPTYARLVELLATAPLPLVFHCTHGKDRVGTGAALMLRLLEVDWATIETDYLLSNDCRRDLNEARLAGIPAQAARVTGVPEESLDLGWMRKLFYVEPDHLAAGRTELERRFPTTGELAAALGLDTLGLAALRDRLLDPPPG